MTVISSLGESVTKARCLEATARAIVRKGIDATTVQDILEGAGLSRRTFYQHFASKDAALRALFEILIDAVIGAIRAAVTSTDPVERVLQAADAYLALWQADPRLSLLLQTEAMRVGSPLAPVRQRLLDTLSTEGARVYQEANRRSLDPLVIRSLVLALEGMLSHTSEAPEVGYDRIRSVYAAIVRRTLAPEGEALPPAPRLGTK